MGVEDKYAQTIAIVYPAAAPSDEYNLPIDKEIQTHVTINILGQIPEVDFSKDELVITLRNIEWEKITEAKVGHLELFGLDSDFLVMTLDAPALRNNRNLVYETLAGVGISSLDKFPEYRPHITLMENYEGLLESPEDLPETVKLGLPTLWWGNEAVELS